MIDDEGRYAKDTAAFLAERINGGKFYEPQWYTEEQRDLWRCHSDALAEHLAVPELVAALEAIVNAFDDDQFGPEYEQAVAALAQARSA